MRRPSLRRAGLTYALLMGYLHLDVPKDDPQCPNAAIALGHDATTR